MDKPMEITPVKINRIFRVITEFIIFLKKNKFWNIVYQVSIKKL